MWRIVVMPANGRDIIPAAAELSLPSKPPFATKHGHAALPDVYEMTDSNWRDRHNYPTVPTIRPLDLSVPIIMA